VFLRRPFQLFRRESWPRLGESVTSPGGVGSCQAVSGSGLQTCDYNLMTWANVTTAADMSMYLARSGPTTRAPSTTTTWAAWRSSVVPYGHGGHAAAGGWFTVQLFSDPDMPDVVCIEHLTSALYLDNREHAGHYAQVTNYLGTEALTPADTGRLPTEMIREM
jgi:Domain of unknown function (DUF5753)